MRARSHWLWAAAAAAIVAAWAGTAAADGECFSTHTSGNEETYLSFCISEHGNLVQFESPERHGHLGAHEGYALCGWFEENRYDAGLHESGFGEATISQPNGANTLPLTITRETTDGHFRLRQTFARDTTEKDVTITMTLTNISGAVRSLVSLVRYFASGDARFARTADSVWAWDGGLEPYGLRLTARTPTVSHATAVEAFDDWLPPAGTGAGCFTDLAATPTEPGMFAGRVWYGWATIKAGGSKTATFVYRRF